MITTSNRKADGTEGRDAAIELLEQRRQVYVNRGRRALLLRALTGETANADDVRAAVEVPESIDPVCLGAVPGSLARAGIIRRAGFAPTSRPDARARPVSIWALADRAAALRWLTDNPDIPDHSPPAQEKAQRRLPLGESELPQ